MIQTADNIKVNYGKRFLKQSEIGALTVTWSRLFHCRVVQGKKEFL